MRIAWIGVLALLAIPASAADFSDWAAIVVAGDFHAHSGATSEVFDNGRQTIADELVGLGFSPSNIEQFSVRAERYPLAHAELSTPQRIAGGLWDLSNRTSAGCFAYFTSHGSRDGVEIGDSTISPRQMSELIDNACAGRPTVVVVSACYSGVFVPALSAPDRIVLTAAAADRSSFGCGETDRYTYFDTCAVAWLPKAGNFVSFAKHAIECVQAREKKEKVDLPSHPQLAVGTNAASFPTWK
jgi:hypothetical protein